MHDDRQELETRIENLERALETSRQIGMALGVLMERYELDQATAFKTLVRIASQEETKVRVVADRLLETGRLTRPTRDLGG